jgi:hypothetical protein
MEKPFYIENSEATKKHKVKDKYMISKEDELSLENGVMKTQINGQTKTSRLDGKILMKKY